MTVANPAKPSTLHRWLIFGFIIVGGGVVGFLTQKLMVMSLRYAIASVVGVMFLAMSMLFIRRLPDVLMYLMVACIPLYTFEKTFFLRDTWVDFGTPGINIGLLDIFLAGLYLTWFLEVIVARTRPWPRWHRMDTFVLAYFLANVLSIITSASVAYSIFEVFRVGKYVLAYYYVAHRLERRHLRLIVWGFFLALSFESALGVFQHRTQRLVGIARTKGAATAELSAQYEVPEFEGHSRAEGTTIDSHAFGIYLVVLLMYPFCLALCRWMSGRDRLIFAGVFFVGIPGLISSFSRGAWGALGIACVFVLIVFFLWKERRALGVFVILTLLATPAVLIGGGSLIGERIFRAPGDIMSARWDTILGGYEVWKQAILTGAGTNAYKHALFNLNMTYELTNDKPAHNLAVFVLSQTGIFGLVTYCALGVLVMVYCVRMMRWKDPLLSPIALAIFSGFLAIQADGGIDFMSFTNQVYLMKFLSCGLIVGMLRLRTHEPAARFPARFNWRDAPT